MRSAMARAKAADPHADLREVAALRAEAVMSATERVLEAALRRPAWREFEYVWFERRLADARRSLEGAPPAIRFGFIESLRPTVRLLCEAEGDRFETGVAASLLRTALERLFALFEGRDDRPLTTSELYRVRDRVLSTLGVSW